MGCVQAKLGLPENLHNWLSQELEIISSPHDGYQIAVNINFQLFSVLVGDRCHPILQIQTLSQTKKHHFSNLFSDLASKLHNSCFQTWRRSWNAIYMFT